LTIWILGTPISSTNKIDRHDITEILLKVALNIITLTLTALKNVTLSEKNKVYILFISVLLLPVSLCVSGVINDLCYIFATFNNISVISWRSILLVEEIGVPGGDHRPTASHWQTWSHNVVSSTPRHEPYSNSSLIGTDFTDS
jgi:hypothetical protein